MHDDDIFGLELYTLTIIFQHSYAYSAFGEGSTFILHAEHRHGRQRRLAVQPDRDWLANLMGPALEPFAIGAEPIEMGLNPGVSAGNQTLEACSGLRAGRP